MANRKIWVIILYTFSISLLTVAFGDMDVFGNADIMGSAESKQINAKINSFNDSVTDLTDANTLEETDEIGISIWGLPSMIGKVMVALTKAIAGVPLIYFVMLSYGIPEPICVVFQAQNTVLLGVLLWEVFSNRKVT